MSKTMTLPNGKVMSGIPESATLVDIARNAVKNGYASREDFSAYPDIYSQLSNKQQNAPVSANGQQTGAEQNTETASTVSGVLKQAENTQLENHDVYNPYAGYIPAAENVKEHPRESLAIAAGVATGGVLPEVATVGNLIVNAGAQALGQVAADSAATGIETSGESYAPESPVLDAASGAAGEVVGLIPKILGRFTGRTAAYLLGRKPQIEWLTQEKIGQEASDLASNPPVFHDELPSKANAEKAADKGIAEAALEKQAEQAALDRMLMENAAHRLSSIEAASYFLKPMLAKKSGALGADFATGLKSYRNFTGGYSTAVLAHPAETAGFEHLQGIPQFEAIMRADNPTIDKLIGLYDAGHDVPVDEAITALNAYDHWSLDNLKELEKTLPRSYLEDLNKVLADSPEVEKYIDHMGVIDPANRATATKQMLKDMQEGLRDAMRTRAESLDEQLNIERHLTSQEYQLAYERNEINVQTALKYKLEALEKMQKQLQEFAKTGEWKGGIDIDEESIYRAMAKTHDQASRGEAVMQLYREFRSTVNALPELRVNTVMDDTLDTLTNLTSDKFLRKIPILGRALGTPARATLRKVRRIGEVAASAKKQEEAAQAIKELSKK